MSFAYRSHVTRCLVGLLLASATCGCSDDSGTDPGEPTDTVASGQVVISGVKGFDFSAEQIRRTDLPDSAAYFAAANSMDILLGGQMGPTMPGQPLPSIIFHLMGSPTPFVLPHGYDPPWAIGEDTDRPSVLRLQVSSLEDVSVVPTDGYATSYHDGGSSFVGSVFAVRTKDDKFALIQAAMIDSVSSDTIRITLDWKYQANGEAQF
jgi:hypothetical protein